MGCKLTQNIKHSCDYNPGGISSILLLDIDDFVSYTFRDDKLYTEGYVEAIKATSSYYELSSVNESNFTETKEGNLYRQELTTFVRTLDSEKLSNLLKTSVNKYLVSFITNDGRAFTFGSDGGASLKFTQQTGQLGESSGYAITISKLSMYPLFEVAVDEVQSPIWILESGFWGDDKTVWTKDGIWK